jgi:hypothetical protein
MRDQDKWTNINTHFSAIVMPRINACIFHDFNPGCPSMNRPVSTVQIDFPDINQRLTLFVAAVIFQVSNSLLAVTGLMLIGFPKQLW